MADESTRRSYQSNDPYQQGGQAPGASRRSSDPLAELARLIGQSDPYTDLGQNVPRRADQPQAAPMDWRKTVAAMPPFENLQPETEGQLMAPRHASHHVDFEGGRDPYYPAAMDSPYSGRPVDDHSYDRPFPVDPQSDHYQRESADGRYPAHDPGHPADRYDAGRREPGNFDAGRYDGARLDGSRHDDSRHEGGRNDGSRHDGGRHDD